MVFLGDESSDSVVFSGTRGQRLMRLDRGAFLAFVDLPMSVAARALGCGETTLRRVWRWFGLPRWPYKELRRRGRAGALRSVMRQREELREMLRARLRANDYDDCDELVAVERGGRMHTRGARAADDGLLRSVDAACAAAKKMDAGGCFACEDDEDDDDDDRMDRREGRGWLVGRKRRRVVVADTPPALDEGTTSDSALLSEDSVDMFVMQLSWEGKGGEPLVSEDSVDSFVSMLSCDHVNKQL